MGNGGAKLHSCFHACGSGGLRSRDFTAVRSLPYDEDGFGHCFSYVRPEPLFLRRTASKDPSSEDTATFRFISGAAVSANAAATPLSTSLNSSSAAVSPAAFQSSSSFSSAPLHPLPRSSLSEAKAAAAGGGGGGEKLDLHWAEGRAGEDCVHLVISEEHGWIFAGIYDGFNGPDAADFLLSNLYPAIEQELIRLFSAKANQESLKLSSSPNPTTRDRTPRQPAAAGRSWEEKQRRWQHEHGEDRSELDRILKRQSSHFKVLKALSSALSRTEKAFLEVADAIVSENPELALIGSCVLAMVIKGEDLYLMNVGDSRAVLAQLPEFHGSKRSKKLGALQITKDHCTGIEEEVRRIRNEHPEDAMAVTNDRVKGSLKVTRAFGAGFLKQPKWNDALLEMFRINYVGTSPYITCAPFLYHHRLCRHDRYLILSSDGLCQYFTNEEAVAEIESFVAKTPCGDPAQHLVEEVLVRAAKRAGMDFCELLEIPQGDRRRYHDDVSVVIISLEGRIWRSCA